VAWARREEHRSGGGRASWSGEVEKATKVFLPRSTLAKDKGRLEAHVDNSACGAAPSRGLWRRDGQLGSAATGSSVRGGGCALRRSGAEAR
jgi:hypothetical protein